MTADHRGGWPGPRKDTLAVRIAPDLNRRLRTHAGPERGALAAAVAGAITEYLERHDAPTPTEPNGE